MNKLIALILAALISASTDALAEAMTMKDGRRIVAKTLRRQGDSVMAANPSENGAKPIEGEIGYPLGQVEHHHHTGAEGG